MARHGLLTMERGADAAGTLAREAAPPADPAALLAIADETR
ncbi:MAG TPA: hypothetical protein VNO54_09130 [Streptosporangiaceae bacterium]|nr:hypothetical protein [Streptosporangiaceae bacterium]